MNYQNLNLKIVVKEEALLQSELDDVKLMFYVACIVFSGAFLILFACVIGLYMWIHKMSLSRKQDNMLLSTEYPARNLDPAEELAKRYTMFNHDNKRLNGSTTLQKNSSNKQGSLKKSNILPSGRLKTNGPSVTMKKSDQVLHTIVTGDTVPSGERLRDELYY